MSSKHFCPICGHEVSIRKVAENGGMDGRYYDWNVHCGKCGLLNVTYAADCFYGRRYYETADDALAAFDLDCQRIKEKHGEGGLK